MAWAPDGCPSTYTVDTGDCAEPEPCELPIDHCADDDPWHQSVSKTDTVESTVRWSWRVDFLQCPWPRPRGLLPDGYAAFLVRSIAGVNYLFSNLPTEIPEPHGTRVTFRRWEMLPASAETASTGDADVRDPA